MSSQVTIGITEKGDPVFDDSWKEWVNENKPAILITKDPLRLFEDLTMLKYRRVIVHCTITGMGGTLIEPNVSPISNALEGLSKLLPLIGHNRIVLRIDPIFPTENGKLLALEVLKQAKEISPNIRVRISFLDNYPHIKNRFKNANLGSLDYNFHAPLEIRKQIWEELGSPETCAEPGLPCFGCVSLTDAKALGIYVTNERKGQRSLCNCVSAKKELLKDPNLCKHNCIYCYWKKEGD